MSSNPFWNEPRTVWGKVKGGEIKYEVVQRISASENYEYGDEVGFIKAKGILMAVNWKDGELADGRYGINRTWKAPLPAKTEWMITNNDSIDYGLEA